jgi:uncharacterized protein (TIGR02186 family)
MRRRCSAGAALLGLAMAALAALPSAGQQPAPEAPGEQVLAGLSQTNVALTAGFEGLELLVFGAVWRAAPVPDAAAPLQVIVAVQGPPQRLSVWRKGRRAGIWMNVEELRVARAPSLYVVATSGRFDEALSPAEDLRHRVSVPLAIRAFGSMALAAEAPAFTEALIRLRTEAGVYRLSEGAVELTRETLFRTTVALPAALTEGRYAVRVFLSRGGQVLDVTETTIAVRKAGIEGWLAALAREQPVAYGLLAVVLAVAAGWGASAVFRYLRG